MLVGLPLELWASIVSENGGLLGQTCYLSQNSTHYLRRSVYVSCSYVLAEFTRISCFSHYSLSQENRRETIVWPIRPADEMK
jgi:hypothetical protein